MDRHRCPNSHYERRKGALEDDCGKMRDNSDCGVFGSYIRRWIRRGHQYHTDLKPGSPVRPGSSRRRCRSPRRLQQTSAFSFAHSNPILSIAGPTSPMNEISEKTKSPSDNIENTVVSGSCLVPEHATSRPALRQKSTSCAVPSSARA